MYGSKRCREMKTIAVLMIKNNTLRINKSILFFIGVLCNFSDY